MPQLGPLYWLGIVLFSWAFLVLLYSIVYTPPVFKVPPLPPLNAHQHQWLW